MFSLTQRLGSLRMSHLQLMRRPMRIVLFLVSAQLMSACAPLATKAEFDRQFSAIVGQDINKVISKLGPPSNTFTMPNGNKLYSFTLLQNTYRTPTTTDARVQGTSGGATGSATTYGGNLVTNSCRVDLTVNSTQRVVDFRSIGNECVARPKAK